MEQQVKDDWIINNQNIFGLPQSINLSLSSIQYEILSQIKNIKINSISDYLGIEIDITKEINLTQSLTIQRVFNEFFGFDDINPLGRNTFNCSMILRYLQLSLLKEYTSERHKNILHFSEYEKQYSTLLNDFLSSNIDTDEQDFIKAELILCENLIEELEKPIYNKINIFNEILNEPCGFKKNIINSIDKRKKYLERKNNNLSTKIKNLFQFIEFLHSNIDNFKQYDKVINKLQLLDKDRHKLRPTENFKDKLKYESISIDYNEHQDLINSNVTCLIINKAKELKICDFIDGGKVMHYLSEINDLKENFIINDLPEILKHKRKYLKYRKEVKHTYLLDMFFYDLYRILENLFNFFNESEYNDFEPLEIKSIEVNSIAERVQEFNQGQTKFILPTPMSKTKERILNNFADFKFFQIEVITDLKYNDKTYKDVKQRNNDSILTPENWWKHKETFFAQRMSTYKDSYTLAEKIKLELSALEKLPINEEAYEILKDRYKEYLEQKEALPPQQTEKIKAIKYKADEYALAYIFDLYASGKQVPINRIEGSFDAKQIKNDSTLFSSYDKTPDGFYRAVKKVVKYDLNKQMDLQNISIDWYNAVKALSNNWLLTEQYLKDKDLVKE